MDKSLRNQFLSGHGRSPYSSRVRQSPASSIVSGRKSLHSSMSNHKKTSLSGRYSVSARSNQSIQVIGKSEHYIVEPYGLPMPVLVSEALTFSEKNSSVFVNCSNNGWAWAVHGRRLLVWQYKLTKLDSPKIDFPRTPQQQQQRRITTSQCRELTLPHCDIGHKATLVDVFIPEGQQMASCLAVSPTGDVRYWPSIAYDSSSIDSTGILDGQEFDYLLSIPPVGYILVTTTCQLVLLKIQIQNGRYNICHRILRPPSGFFGGIGKKFASIIIGMNSGPEKENKFVKISGRYSQSNEEWLITVLADRWIQRWNFDKNGTEQFILEDQEILKRIREYFQQKFCNSQELHNIELSIYDMQMTNSDIYILCNASYCVAANYAFVHIHEENNVMQIVNFHHFNPSGHIFFNSELKFILNRNIAYIYSCNDFYIFVMNILQQQQQQQQQQQNLPSTPNSSNAGDGGDGAIEMIEFQTRNDKIMSAFVCYNIPVFFLKTQGLVSILPSDFDTSDYLNSSFSPDYIGSPALSETVNLMNQTSIANLTPKIMENNITLFNLDPNEFLNDENDFLASNLKAAFIYHLKHNQKASNDILKELFPNTNELEEIDSSLDKMVVTIAQELAEDIPSADPRWEQQEYGFNKLGLGSSNSLQISTQLDEKMLAMSYFIQFLHSSGLWNDLNAVTYRGFIKSTAHMMADINEKIVAAKALKLIQNKYSKLVDEAIKRVLIDWNEQPTGNLIHQDLFYVKPTRIEDIFKNFVDMLQQQIEEQYQTNQLSIAILNEITQFRIEESEKFELPENKRNSYEYLPWTAMSGKNGIRDSLLNLIDITLKHGARSTGEPEIRQKLYQQMMELIDFVLDGRKNYLESIKDNEKYGVLVQQYESQRRNLIYPLVEDEQYELAAKLAEKYLDFQILVVICDRTQNQERLDDYIEKYKEYDFSQFAINWHLRQNKQGELFERFKTNQDALTKFLGDHPSLAWIQMIFNGDLEKASRILFQLSQNEIECMTRKKSMLSLSKLSALSTDTDMSIQISEINSELNLIEYQEQLPEALLLAFGYDTENLKVLKAEEIINLLISDENETANEFDFRKALELLNYVEDPFEVRHKIWCSAILKDSWIDYDMSSPIDKIQNTLFFKLIDLCYLMDGDLESFLPPMDDFLNSAELGDLINNKSFQYLLKLGYEHIYQSYSQKTEGQEMESQSSDNE